MGYLRFPTETETAPVSAAPALLIDAHVVEGASSNDALKAAMDLSSKLGVSVRYVFGNEPTIVSPVRTPALSRFAIQTLELMGQYHRFLRVPRDGSATQLVFPPARVNWPDVSATMDLVFDVLPSVATELIGSSAVRLLPAERTNSIMGWRELGFDGEVADFYGLVQ